MYENNQYGYAMTKPLSTGCIKQRQNVPSWKTFNMLLETVDLYAPIEHLFFVDINFNFEKATVKTHMYSEIYTLIFEEQQNTRS